MTSVSILIIAYNQREFVEETLRSALEQDYDDLEVVIADDSSTDGTQDVIRRFAGAYGRRLVPVLAERNSGVTDNFNRALRASRGDLIALQGGDDVLLPGKVRAQVEWLTSHPRHRITYHDVDVFDSSTGRTLYRFSDRHPMLEGDAGLVVREGTFFAGTSVMVRRECVPAHGFESSIAVTSDWLFYIECLAGGGLIGPTPGVLARYRRHPGNVTSNTRRGRQEEWQTLEIVRSRYPALRAAAEARAADLSFLDAVRDLRSGRPGAAAAGMARSLRLGGLKWNSGRLVAREAAFLFRSKWRGTTRSE